MSKFFFQTLQVPRTFTMHGKKGAGNAVGGAVKLLHKSIKALNSWAVQYRVNQELKKHEDKIEAELAKVESSLNSGKQPGVLLAIGLMEWEAPDPTGTRAKAFVYMHIAGSGISPERVLQKYRSVSNLVPGVPRGWRPLTNFVWVTRGSQ